MDSNKEILLIKKLWKNLSKKKFYLVGMIIISALLGYILNTPPFTTPEFKSYATIVPPNLKNAKSLTFLSADFRGFGTASTYEMEAMVAVLNSDQIFHRITQKFDLENHYNLQYLPPPAREKEMRKRFSGNLISKINKKSLIQIEAYDKNPDTAKAILNEAINCINDYVETCIKREEGLKNLENSIVTLTEKRKELLDSCKKYRKQLKIYRLDNMSELMATEQSPKFMSNDFFHLYYDKLIHWEAQTRDLQGCIGPMKYELERRKENLRTYPKLVSTTAEGISNPIIARPNILLQIFITTLGGGLLFISLTIFSAWIREEI